MYLSKPCDKDMKWSQDYNLTNFIPNTSALHSKSFAY